MKKLLVLLLSLLVVVGCTKKPEAPKQEDKKMPEKTTETSGKPKVTVTTTFLEDMISVLAKDFVDITLIIGAGGDPHTYEPKPEDFAKLDSADMIFYHGLHFEGHMIEALKQKGAFEVARNFNPEKLRELEEDGVVETDPHFWFDIDLYKQAVETAAADLVSKLPEHKDAIEANSKKYLTQLDELREYATTKFAEIPEAERILITPHDAFNYFGKQYNVQVHAPQGITTEAEVDISALQEVADLVVELKPKAIFAESSTNPERMHKVKELAAAAGYEVKVAEVELYSDSLAPKGHKGDNYIDMVKHNVDTIVENLK